MMHPSGLTWERWSFPFKTEYERELVRQYLHPAQFDDNNPF